MKLKNLKLSTAFLSVVAYSIASIYAQSDGSFKLIIDRDTIPIELNKDYKHQPKKGKAFNFKLIRAKIMTYKDEKIAFKYPGSLNISSSVLEEGVEQFLLINSTGNIILIQKYGLVDPRELIGMMLSEITKEGLDRGHVMTERDFRRKISGNQYLEGIEATLHNGEGVDVYTVAANGSENEGILVITLLTGLQEEESRQMIDLFFDSLEIFE